MNENGRLQHVGKIVAVVTVSYKFTDCVWRR
jgi:hypothetical protein